MVNLQFKISVVKTFRKFIFALILTLRVEIWMKKLKPKQRDYHIWIVTSRKMSVNWYCLSSSSSLAKLQSCLYVQQTSISPYLSFAPLFYWTLSHTIDTQSSEKQNKTELKCLSRFGNFMLSTLNVITLGPWETDNINFVITFTEQLFGWLTVKKPNGLWRS